MTKLQLQTSGLWDMNNLLYLLPVRMTNRIWPYMAIEHNALQMTSMLRPSLLLNRNVDYLLHKDLDEKTRFIRKGFDSFDSFDEMGRFWTGLASKEWQDTRRICKDCIKIIKLKPRPALLPADVVVRSRCEEREQSLLREMAPAPQRLAQPPFEPSFLVAAVVVPQRFQSVLEAPECLRTPPRARAGNGSALRSLGCERSLPVPLQLELQRFLRQFFVSAFLSGQPWAPGSFHELELQTWFHRVAVQEGVAAW